MIRKQRLNLNGREVTFFVKERNPSSSLLLYHSSLLNIEDPLAHPQYLLNADFIAEIVEIRKRIEVIAPLDRNISFIQEQNTDLNSSNSSLSLTSPSLNSINGIEITSQSPIDSQVLFYSKELNKVIWKTIDESLLGTLRTTIVSDNLPSETYNASNISCDYLKTNLLHIPYAVEGGKGIRWGTTVAEPEIPYYGISVGLSWPETENGYTFPQATVGGMRFTMNDTINRGWIFTRVGYANNSPTYTPVAAITNTGDLHLSGGAVIDSGINSNGSLYSWGNTWLTLGTADPNNKALYLRDAEHTSNGYALIYSSFGTTYGRLVLSAMSTTISPHTHNYSALTETGHTHIADINSFRVTGTTRDKWYTSPTTSVALTTQATTGNRLYTTPFPAPNTKIVEQIMVNVTTLIAHDPLGNASIGIYSDENCSPKNKLYDSGKFVLDTGALTYSASPMITLTGGNMYWLAFVTQSATTMRAIAGTGMIPVLGYTSALGTVPTLFAYSGLAAGWSALPTVLDIAGMTEQNTNASVPAVFVRLSG